MKIALCDDDTAVLSQLKDFVLTYAANHGLDYAILEFEQSQPLLEAARQDSDIKIMFLDIYMSPVSGMELAEALRADGNDCAIIFVTTSTDHYAESYEVDAQHYLVKPITYDRVERALNRCHQLLVWAAKYVAFSSFGRELQVPLNRIRYVEVFRNQTILHADSDIPLRSPLSGVLEQLSDKRFLRTHRSFLVNLDYVASRHGNDILLKSGERLPLSRTLEKTFEQEYGRYLTMTGGYL